MNTTRPWLEPLLTLCRKWSDQKRHQHSFESDCSDEYYAASDACENISTQIHAAIAALDEADREMLVALYVPLRSWAY